MFARRFALSRSAQAHRVAEINFSKKVKIPAIVQRKSMISVVGEYFGHYKVCSDIGAGGMGEVYLAEDIKLSRKIALKLLLLELTRNKNCLERFEQEVQAISALN